MMDQILERAAGQQQLAARVLGLWMVVGEGLRVTTIGLLCGVAGAYASTRLLASLLFGVSATDAMTFAVVPAVFVAVTVLASLIPPGAPHGSIRSSRCECE